jgi:6-phosphogluconate dehydrogenase
VFSGSGKTTIGTILSKRTRLPFFDADDFHPNSNVQKMSQGIPLTDHDRHPWLVHLAEKIKEWEAGGGAILACSALKEAYRTTLQSVPNLFWVHLYGDRMILEERLKQRENHYMPPGLLDSQLEAWENPSYGLHINVNNTPKEMVDQILKAMYSMTSSSHIGIIGMGVMGKSLALNMAEKGIPVSVYNRTVLGKEENIATDFVKENPQFPLLKGFDELSSFLESLNSPKKILLMIPAGKAIDLQIEGLLTHLKEGDVIIDGGNSFFEDSNRRCEQLSEKNIAFLPMGVSGGEEGARKGPSLMPGGNEMAYQLLAPYLKKIAAKDKNTQPCVTYVGPDGAGHFIKMVHNSIEYGEMQLLAETVHLLHHGLGLSYDETSKVLQDWANDGLKSYLLEITADILLAKDQDGFVLDRILDQAGQKGTGGWSISTALDNHVPYSSLFEAVTARQLSSDKKNREELSLLFSHNFKKITVNKVEFIKKLKNAYSLASLINHETGFDLMKKVAENRQWNLNFSEISRIWTNGCIIRSQLMEDLSVIYKDNLGLLNQKSLTDKINLLKPDLAFIVGKALQHDFAVPVFSSSINYLLGKITLDSSANLIQAQRDYFGAHTYIQKGDQERTPRHTDWQKLKQSFQT